MALCSYGLAQGCRGHLLPPVARSRADHLHLGLRPSLLDGKQRCGRLFPRYVVMALYSYGPIQVRSTLSALHSYGPIYLWPYVGEFDSFRACVEVVSNFGNGMALFVTLAFLWPYTVVALHSYGPI